MNKQLHGSYILWTCLLCAAIAGCLGTYAEVNRKTVFPDGKTEELRIRLPQAQANDKSGAQSSMDFMVDSNSNVRLTTHREQEAPPTPPPPTPSMLFGKYVVFAGVGFFVAGVLVFLVTKTILVPAVCGLAGITTIGIAYSFGTYPWLPAVPVILLGIVFLVVLWKLRLGELFERFTEAAVPAIEYSLDKKDQDKAKDTIGRKLGKRMPAVKSAVRSVKNRLNIPPNSRNN